MTRRPSPQVEDTEKQGPRVRAAKLAATLLLFLLLAYAGIQGQLEATRQAELDEILLCRDELQDALDARRSASGPTSGHSVTKPRPWARAVAEWTAKLESRIAAFHSSRAPPSELEELDLSLSRATLAIARQEFADALGTAGALDERPAPGGTGTRDRGAEILRVRADAHYDACEWSAALDDYRRVLARQPEELSVAERVAECLVSLRQGDQALRAYAELADRLENRGSRLMTQLDHSNAARDFNKAATIRHWLFEQGRRDLAADLARSYSSCAAALLELRSPDHARVYVANAIDLQTQLVRKEARSDLTDDLADNYARYAAILLQLRKPDEALAHLGSAIDLEGRLANQGQPELRRRLATNLALRGVVLQAQGRTDAAARDFEKAAEVFDAIEAFGEAVEWQKKALGLTPEEERAAARARLDRYTSRERSHGPSANGS